MLSFPASDSPPSTSVEEVYRRYFPLIRRKCERMLNDPQEAADIAQETFLRFWREQNDFQDIRQNVAWIYRTSVRLAIDRLRARKRHAEPSDPESLDRNPGEWASGESRLHAQRLFSRLARELPRRELEIAMLSRLDGLTQAEIGEVMQMSERNVRRLLSRFDEHLVQLREEGA